MTGGGAVFSSSSSESSSFAPFLEPEGAPTAEKEPARAKGFPLDGRASTRGLRVSVIWTQGRRKRSSRSGEQRRNLSSLSEVLLLCSGELGGTGRHHVVSRRNHRGVPGRVKQAGQPIDLNQKQGSSQEAAGERRNRHVLGSHPLGEQSLLSSTHLRSHGDGVSGRELVAWKDKERS